METEISSIRRQVIGIPMGTNCAPSLANLFLYRYESAFIDRLMAKKDGHEVAASFHNTFRFIDDTLSIDNPHWIAACSSSSRMADRIYPAELSLNDTTPSSSSAPVISVHCSALSSSFLFDSTFHSVWRIHWSTAPRLSFMFHLGFIH